jgi:hypothetical protein
VLGQPFITQQPQSCTNIAGSTATFTVLAAGAAPLAYHWQRDSAIGALDFSDMTDGTNATLVLTNLQPSDSADYLVVIINAGGAITSQVAQLLVATPPHITSQPSSFSLSLGANITNRVGTTLASPAPAYQWFFNGAALAAQTTKVLILTNLQMANAGAYTVVVTNVAGAVTSRVATLTVDPTFTKITTGDVVRQGSSWGAAWGDVDNDGYLDLVVLPTSQAPMLFHNNHDGTFTKMAPGTLPGLCSLPGCARAVLGDYDNDGWLDLLVADPCNNNNCVTLFKNKGDGTFTNVAMASSLMQGLVTCPLGPGWVDYNNDGWLDLFVADTCGSGPNGSGLFHNNGDGSFTPVPAAGLASYGFGVNGAAWADYDNDGYPDLFFGAGPGGDLLYHNNGDGTFTRTVGSPSDATKVGWGCAWGDYDNSGFPSLFVINASSISPPNFLYHNEGNGTFKQVTQGSLVTTPMYSVGAAWGDYDNDGFLDLLVMNLNNSSPTTNGVFHNNGDGTFTPVSLGSLTSDLGAFGCGGWADYDNDGFLDLFVANNSGNHVMYRNNGNSNGWVKVQCVGQVSNRSGIGAKVRVKAFYRGAGRCQLREVFGGDGIANTQPLLAYFGLGDATNIDTLRIEWPSGIVQEMYNLAPRQSLTVTEPVLTVPWRKRTVLPGSSVTLSVSSQLTDALGSQWQLNGSNLPGQTNQTLVLASAGLADAGQYRLAIQTSTGLVLSPAANIVVLSQQPQLVALPMTNGYFALQVTAGVTPGLLIQASTNLTDWVPVLTNRSTNTPLIFRDTTTARYPRRFYRTFTP